MGKKIEIDIDKKMVDIYTKIATWHNDDATKEGLKTLSQDVIEDIMNFTLQGMDVKTKLVVQANKVEYKEEEEEKKERSLWKKILNI